MSSIVATLAATAAHRAAQYHALADVIDAVGMGDESTLALARLQRSVADAKRRIARQDEAALGMCEEVIAALANSAWALEDDLLHAEPALPPATIPMIPRPAEVVMRDPPPEPEPEEFTEEEEDSPSPDAPQEAGDHPVEMIVAMAAANGPVAPPGGGKPKGKAARRKKPRQSPRP